MRKENINLKVELRGPGTVGSRDIGKIDTKVFKLQKIFKKTRNGDAV